MNYGSWRVAILGTAAGQPARVGGCATGDLPIALTGRVSTTAAGGTPRVERVTDERGDALAVGGSILPGELRQVHRAMSDPAAGAGQILRSILQQTGVSVGAVETALAK